MAFSNLFCCYKEIALITRCKIGMMLNNKLATSVTSVTVMKSEAVMSFHHIISISILELSYFHTICSH